MNVESIIFDLDGTLWDSSEKVAAAWTRVIRDCPYPAVNGISLTADDIKSVMGMPMDAIADKLFPALEKDVRIALIESCSDYENSFLAENGGILFAETKKTLAALADKHRLFIVSNCQCGYIEAFFAFHGLGGLFSGHMCWGDTKSPKSVTISKLMEKYGCTSAAYVGDTQGDCTAAYEAGIPFVHAAYGFGKITQSERAAASVSSISELIKIFSDDDKTAAKTKEVTV